MSMDFDAPEGATTPQGDGAVFAPTPVWARSTSKKRRGFGGSRRTTTVTEPTPEAPVVSPESGMAAGVAGASVVGGVEPMGAYVEPAPVHHDTHVTETRTTTPVARRGVSGPAVAAGVVALAAIGGLAWYASQPRDNGMTQLTPGAPANSEVATNTPPTAAQLPITTGAATTTPTPVASTTERSVSTTTHVAAPARTTTTHRSTAVASRTPTRSRPAASDTTATDAGVDASATAPMVSTPAPAPTAPSTTAPMDSSTSVNPMPAPSSSMSTSPAPSTTTAPEATTVQ